MTDIITVDTDKVFGADQLSQGMKRATEELHVELLKHISPAGALRLNPLLDERRLRYGIPDECFKSFVFYETVHVFQLDLIDTEMAGSDSRIVRPDATRDRDRRQAHRGIVIGAGLGALDIGISHGWYLGHVVHFIQLAPFRQRSVTIKGKDFDFLVMRAGDLRSSEDTEALRRSGKIRVDVVVDEKGRPEHRLVWEDGRAYSPIEPYMAEDQ